MCTLHIGGANLKSRATCDSRVLPRSPTDVHGALTQVVAARVREANQYLVKERDDLYERARKSEARLEKELVPLQMEITQLRGELEDLQGPLRASLMASLMACDCV